MTSQLSYLLFFLIGEIASQSTTLPSPGTDDPLCEGLTCDEDQHCEVRGSFCWLGIFCLPPHSICVDNCKGPNEIWEPCPHCEQRRVCGEQLACVTDSFCNSQCVCDFGFIRNQNGTCILESSCPTSSGSLNRLLNM